MKVDPSLILASVALVGALVAIGVSFLAKYRASTAYELANERPLPKDFLQAFEKLERDCDDMWSKVNSNLGRINRLKALQNAVDNSLIEPAAGEKPRAELNAGIGETPLTAIHSRADLLRLAQAKGLMAKPQ